MFLLQPPALMRILKPGQDKVLSNREVFEQYAVPEELPATTRGSDKDSLLIKAATLFNKKDYAATLPVLDSITKQRPGEAQLQLSPGICYLQSGRPDSAINTFDKLSSAQSAYKYDALLWKALVFLKQDKKEKCLEVLKQIPPEASNYKKAEKMMGQLSK